ncbi:MAG: hypothetical protein AAGC54_19895 [Cyanobacteria bacterium P01_F01_bin.4]
MSSSNFAEAERRIQEALTTNAKTLNLSRLKLDAVPKELGQLANLTRLDLSANTDLKSPPPEVVEQGTRAILSYLQEQQDDGEHQWIVNQVNVGSVK